MPSFPAISRTGETVVPGGVYSTVNWSGLAGAHVRAKDPASPPVASGNNIGYRLNDGCRDYVLDGLSAKSAWRGYWATLSSGGLLRGCVSDKSGLDAFLFGGCKNTRVVACQALRSGQGPISGWKDPPADGDRSAAASFYFSFGSTDVGGTDLLARDGLGAGIHANGTPENGTLLRGLTLTNFQVIRCGSEGTGGMQLDAVRGGVFTNGLVALCNAGIEMAGDGERSGWGSIGLDFHRMTLWVPDGKFTFNMGGGASKIAFTDSIIGFSQHADWIENTEDGGDFDPPSFHNCILAGVGPKTQKNMKAAGVLDNCRFMPLADTLALFRNPASADFSLLDPSLGIGWQSAAAPTPPPPPPQLWAPCPSCVGHTPAYPAGKVPA